MASKSSLATFGTPGSTFSAFASGTLHRVYDEEFRFHEEEDERPY